MPYLVQIGSIHLSENRHVEAEAVLRKAISIDSQDADALCGLALVLKVTDQMRVNECLKLLRAARAIALDRERRGEDGGEVATSAADIATHLATLLTDVGVRLKMAGLPASAIENYEEALQVCPTYAQALYNLGVAYSDANELVKARKSYEQCLQVNPMHVEAWCNLGVLHRSEGNLDLAIEGYQRALSIHANFELAKSNLAVALCEKATFCKRKDRKLSRSLYKKALVLAPHFADAHYNLAVWYAEAGKLERALVEYNLAIKFNPQLTEAYNNLGVVYKDMGNMHMAIQCYKKALECNEKNHQTHNNIAVVYTLIGNVESAVEHLQLANALSPDYAEAHNNMGVLLRDQGDIDSAITCYERCSKLDSRSEMAAQNKLHALCYSEYWSPAAIFEQHKKWGIAFQSRIDQELIEAANNSQATNPVAIRLLECLKNPPAPDPSEPRGPGTNRPLRVGFLSPDFFTHSVSYFAEVLLTHLDPGGFKLFAYSNVAQPDAKTKRFKSLVGEDNWRNSYGETASSVAKMIMDDEIDILVELAGHTANNRLDVMALRLAPVQITWIGYPNTTGLSSIHYRVTDGIVDPPETTQQFCEKLWRLPDCFLCYTPSQDAPEEPCEAPSQRSGGIITFGSFNVLAKTQKRTVNLWAEILHRVPNSRLLMKAKPFASISAKRRIEKMFEEEGICADRLDLVPLIPATRSHLQAYSNVDVGLDPFPYAGTTTTCEALYMGVPVITLGVDAKNGNHAHNVGVSLLRTIGHDELIAYCEEDYVEKAVSLARDLPRLKKIRKELRNDMMNSPLGQAEEYVRNVEEMFCEMWIDRGGQIGNISTVVENVKFDARGYDGMGGESGGSTTPLCRSVSEESHEQQEEPPAPEDNDIQKKGN